VHQQFCRSWQNLPFLRLDQDEIHQHAAVSTREIQDTNPWTYLDTRIAAGADTHRVDICVVRNPSDDPDVRISGSAWIDDVNLVPEPAGQRKP
jgi:hypothetical protein